VAKQKRRGGNQVDVRPAPPVVDLDAKPELAEGEEPKPKPKQQIELFKLDGKAYYMAEPGANLMLKVMKTARTEGMIGAVGELLEELIGPETYKVLMDLDDLTNEELTALMDRVMHFSMGRMEAVLGNT